jgi:hypothetical protein
LWYEDEEAMKEIGHITGAATYSCNIQQTLAKQMGQGIIGTSSVILRSAFHYYLLLLCKAKSFVCSLKSNSFDTAPISRNLL